MEAEVTVFERTPETEKKNAAAPADEKEEKPGKDKKEIKEPEGPEPMIGVSMQDVSGNSALSLFGSEYGVKDGVYVTALTEGMNDKVLTEGDRIVAVNGNEINSTSDVKEIVKASKIGDVLDFQISRDGKLLSVKVTVFEKTEEYAEAEEETEDESLEDLFPGWGSLPESLGDLFGGRHG